MTVAVLRQIAIDAFDLIDWITGTITGGIEAPRIRMDVEEQDENIVVITWRNPETCGLSDCRYHNKCRLLWKYSKTIGWKMCLEHI